MPSSANPADRRASLCDPQLDEMTALYDQSQRDNRAKAGEIQRLNVENDKLKDQNNNLGRENKKLDGQSQYLLSLI